MTVLVACLSLVLLPPLHRVARPSSRPRAIATATAPRGFGGFGGFGSVDQLIDEFEAEDAAAGALLPAELRAKRNRILLKWADFVRTAGAPPGPPAEPLAELRNVSLSFADGCVLEAVSWRVCEGQIVGVVGESGAQRARPPRRTVDGLPQPPQQQHLFGARAQHQHARAGGDDAAYSFSSAGCGKTTQLRMLAGEVSPTDGDVWFSESVAAQGPSAVAHVPHRRSHAAPVTRVGLT
jgi:hypothetical protein